MMKKKVFPNKKLFKLEIGKLVSFMVIKYNLNIEKNFFLKIFCFLMIRLFLGGMRMAFMLIKEKLELIY